MILKGNGPGGSSWRHADRDKHCCWFSKSWYPIHWQKSNKENRTRELFFKLRWGPCLPSCGTSSAQPFNHLVPSWKSFYLLEMGLFNLCIDSRFVRVRNWHIEVEPKYLSKYWQIKTVGCFRPAPKNAFVAKSNIHQCTTHKVWKADAADVVVLIFQIGCANSFLHVCATPFLSFF